VSKRGLATALVAGMMTVFAGASPAVEQGPGEVPITKDLTAVIALQGLPCGKVVSATQRGEDDYVAACEDGNRYRITVNPDGRVIVEKLD
jgi:hypothetical protein